MFFPNFPGFEKKSEQIFKCRRPGKILVSTVHVEDISTSHIHAYIHAMLTLRIYKCACHKYIYASTIHIYSSQGKNAQASSWPASQPVNKSATQITDPASQPASQTARPASQPVWYPFSHPASQPAIQPATRPPTRPLTCPLTCPLTVPTNF